MSTHPSLLRWPWALWSRGDDLVSLQAELRERYSGGNLFAGSRSSRIGSHFEPLVASRDELALFDISHNIDTLGFTTIQITSNCSLRLEGLVPKVARTERSYVDGWANFFEELYYARSNKSDERLTYSWRDIQSFIEQSIDEPRDATLALIVEIAERFRSSISDIVRGMRSALSRERTFEDVSRAKEFDSASLRWISNNPGESLREKLGGTKKVLCVRRTKNFDSFENRILKDFLVRCDREAGRYLQNTKQKFRNSQRAREVRSFAEICRGLSRDEQFEKVRPPSIGDPPSYAVLHNAKYRLVWNYYLRLLKLQDERDDLWRWQNRTWGEVTSLLVSVCLYRLSANETGSGSFEIRSLLEGEPVLNHQQIKGLRIAAGSEPGPFLMTVDSWRNSFVVDLVNVQLAYDHPHTRDLANCGARLFLVLNPVDGAGRSTPVIAVWSVNGLSSSEECSSSGISASVGRAISNINSAAESSAVKRSVSGIVFLTGKGDFSIVEQGTHHYVISCPVDFHKWYEGLTYTIPLAIEELIGRAAK